MKNHLQLPSDNENISSDEYHLQPSHYKKLEDSENQKIEKKEQEIPKNSQKINFFQEMYEEFKSTFYLEDWLATYLGCFISLVVIIIYLANPNIGPINMVKWDQNPFLCFSTGSNGTYFILLIIAYSIFCIWVINSFYIFFKYNKNFFFCLDHFKSLQKTV